VRAETPFFAFVIRQAISNQSRIGFRVPSKLVPAARPASARRPPTYLAADGTAKAVRPAEPRCIVQAGALVRKEYLKLLAGLG
jgi:hypothetical protein